MTKTTAASVVQPQSPNSPRRRWRAALRIQAASAGCLLAALATPAAAAAPPIAAVVTIAQDPGTQDPIERLRREQDDILRKAERLQGLMQRLQERYQREGKNEQVALLQQGIAHLERSGLLREVAGIRDDLAAQALSEAVRKQRAVVDELERLLSILLERKSIENLDQEINRSTELARDARELQRRQEQLQRDTASATRSEPSAAERELAQQLAQLAQEQRRESQRNARQAGARRPFLESALQRVEDLLREQDRLEQAIGEERTGANTAVQQQKFDLGNLVQATRELSAQVRDQSRQGELADAAKSLERAVDNADPSAIQQARDRLREQLQGAPRRPGGPEGTQRDTEWAQLRERLEQSPAGATPAERGELQQLARAAQQLAERRAEEAAKANSAEAGSLRLQAERMADAMRQDPAATARPDAKDTAADAVRQAAENLASAQQQAADKDPKAAQQQLQAALRALDQARERLQQQHPDAAQQANSMAAEADAAARDLQNAPEAQAAERSASSALERAEQALRQTSSAVETSRQSGAPQPTEPAMQQARQQLQQARETLQQALANENQDRGSDLQQAAERQQQLRAQAEAATQRLQQARQQGQLSEAQAKAAAERMQQAMQQMQQAQQQLGEQRQANAATAQEQAARAVEQAQQAMQQNRPASPEQQQALQQQAQQQQQLAEDIVKLAQELKERQNKQAERALQEAAQAAQKAQQAMERGDAEQTMEQQEQARQKLEEAAEQLEEERDRYQDLRQEELLFKMKDELGTFLQKQRPITQQTLETQQAAPPEGLSRPARRKLNQLGEEEQELAGRLEFLTNALVEEGNLVYRTVLQANREDLQEVARRLGGRSPDPGTYTTMLQQDIERRTENLLAALEREQQRREQQRREQQQQQQQQQQKGQNRFNPQRERLVSLIAELEMLKTLELDTRKATSDLKTLIDLRNDESISEAEVALVERLAHRHADVTRLFQQIKAGVEQAMQAMQPQGQEEGQEPAPRRGR